MNEQNLKILTNKHYELTSIVGDFLKTSEKMALTVRLLGGMVTKLEERIARLEQVAAANDVRVGN